MLGALQRSWTELSSHRTHSRKLWSHFRTPRASSPESRVAPRDLSGNPAAAGRQMETFVPDETDNMNLKSLLLCRDPQVLKTLGRLLDEMRVGVEVCSEVEFGMEMFSRKKFDAVIVDMGMPGGADLLRALQRTSHNRNLVTFALIDGQTNLRTAFELGAHFVVHKPISPERAKLTMRAAHNLMRRDRRNLNRHNLQVVASLIFESGQEIQAIVTDLSDTGMSVFLAEPPTGGCNVRLALPLPGTQKTVEGWGEMVWVDAEGRAGIRFVQLPQISQKELLAQWLKHLSSFGRAG